MTYFVKKLANNHTKKYLTIFFILFLISFQVKSQQIERVEPPNWWIGMEDNSLQLLVKGHNIGKLSPVIKYKGVRISKVNRVDSPNYLFLDLIINDSAEAGTFNIVLNDDDQNKVESIKYELKQRSSFTKSIKGFDQSDVMYLITPDRFANGNQKNDNVDGMRETINRADDFGRHGGDIEGIRMHLSYIKDLGFTAIWLNPLLENDQDKWSYHGYSTTDYYKIDPRFGTNEEYKIFCAEARSMGIKIIMDQIVNHCGSEHWWMKDPPTKDWINHNTGEAFIGTNHRKETLQDPYASAYDRDRMVNGWFVPTMPDLNQNNQFMSKYLIQNSIWWVEYAGISGIRQDTYSYADERFMSDWSCAIMNEYPEMNIVAEEWTLDPNTIAYWQKGRNNKDGNNSCLPSMMDFPMTMALIDALNEEESWGGGWIKLYQSLCHDHVYTDPSNLVIFPDNHDMSRIYTNLSEDYDKFKMAISYILTTRGIPQIYYGTEILLSHPGTDSHGAIREDYPGGWQGDEINAFTNKGLSDKQLEAREFVKQLLHWRKDNTLVHNGRLMHFQPHDGFYVYFRYNDSDVIMVVLNKNTDPTKLELDRYNEMIGDYLFADDVITKSKYLIKNNISLDGPGAYIFELSKS